MSIIAHVPKWPMSGFVAVAFQTAEPTTRAWRLRTGFSKREDIDHTIRKFKQQDHTHNRAERPSHRRSLGVAESPMPTPNETAKATPATDNIHIFGDGTIPCTIPMTVARKRKTSVEATAEIRRMPNPPNSLTPHSLTSSYPTGSAALNSCSSAIR
jgi:hypothetical protein